MGLTASQLTERETTLLYGRGVSDDQINLFQIGYLRTIPEGFPEEFLRWARGVKLGDVFVFPLTTVTGAIKGFQFRSVEREKRGYTDYFLSQDEPAMFGLHQAMPHIWKSESVFLVEGVYDLAPIQRHRPDAFATMTAKIPPNLLRMLLRLVRRIWLGYDMDQAGRKAAFGFAREHGREFEQVKVVSYPKIHRLGSNEWIKDPGDLWETWGDTEVKKFVQFTTES